MEFTLTPNAVKVRAPGFAEMVCLGMGGWKDQPILYTKEAPVIMAKDWGDPRPQAQFGVAASIAKPMFDAVRTAKLLEQIYIDPGWKAQIPGWDFADGKDRLMLQQMLGADDLGRFHVVGNDGALLPGAWATENILPEHLRTRVSVYHGKAADGPVFDHFSYRLKDLPIEFGEAGAAAVQVQQLRAAGIDARAAARQLLDEFEPRLTAIALAHPKGYDLGASGAAKRLVEVGVDIPDVIDALSSAKGLDLSAAKTVQTLVQHPDGPRVDADDLRLFVEKDDISLRFGDSFQRIAKQTLAQLNQHPSLEY